MPPREVPTRPKGLPAGLDPEDFDAIREAVMETPRGRWFLEEYATRLRRNETAGLVDSMRRLEAAVAANHDSIMSRLAAALRQDEDPVEAAVPAEPEAKPMPKLAPRHMKYYRADEELFEPAPEATIAAVPRLVETAAEAEIQPPRRRIVIIRHQPGEQIDVPLADEFARAS